MHGPSFVLVWESALSVYAGFATGVCFRLRSRIFGLRKEISKEREDFLRMRSLTNDLTTVANFLVSSNETHCPFGDRHQYSSTVRMEAVGDSLFFYCPCGASTRVKKMGKHAQA